MPVPHDIGVRIQALAFLQLGVPVEEIQRLLGPSKATIYRWRRTAITRGYDSEKPEKILLEYLVNKPRSGRPRKATVEIEEKIIKILTKSSVTRALTGLEIGLRVGVSPRTVQRVLKRLQWRKVKATVKPGLTEKMKKARYAFALKYKDWTLEDWKRVIWSDETSVILGQRRGGHRIWRRVYEAQDPQCKRIRWKGHSEFMFWGCFTYDKKGPFHIWKAETAAQKKAAQAELDAKNAAIEAENREIWELETAMRRINITRNQGGRRPAWRHTKETGAYIRHKGKGGIDWYRYQKEVLVPKLIPFAKECMINRLDTLVQEDNAPSHACKYQDELWNLSGVLRLLWPGNSPDLNAIEPTWMYMKRDTTKKGPPTQRKVAEKLWTECWKHMPQSRIRRWIERIPYHIQEIIRLEGGNGYKEGVPKGNN
jgi:transposase